MIWLLFAQRTMLIAQCMRIIHTSGERLFTFSNDSLMVGGPFGGPRTVSEWLIGFKIASFTVCNFYLFPGSGRTERNLVFTKEDSEDSVSMESTS